MRATKEDARAALFALERLERGEGGPTAQASDLHTIRAVLVRCLTALPTVEAVVRDRQRKAGKRRRITSGGSHE